MYWERWFEWVTYLEVGEVEPTVVEWELMRDKESKMAMSRGSYLANETSKEDIIGSNEGTWLGKIVL